MIRTILLTIMLSMLTTIGHAENASQVKQNHIRVIHVAQDEFKSRYLPPDTIIDITYTNENELMASVVRDPHSPVLRIFNDLNQYAVAQWMNKRTTKPGAPEYFCSDWTNDTIYVVESMRRYTKPTRPDLAPFIYMVNSCDTVSIGGAGDDGSDLLAYLPVDTMPDLFDIDLRLAVRGDVNEVYNKLDLHHIPSPKNRYMDLALTSDLTGLYSALQKSTPPKKDKLYDVVTHIIIKDGYLDITRIIIDGRLHTLSTE